MLVIPCSATSTSAAARKKIADVEGVMPDHLRGRPASSGGAPAIRDRSRSPRRPATRPSLQGEPCHAWNARQGQCAARGPCRRGFTHGICNVCYREGHRSCDVHPEEAKGKGKNK